MAPVNEKNGCARQRELASYHCACRPGADNNDVPSTPRFWPFIFPSAADHNFTQVRLYR
jgi:hypothetical protein